MTTTEKQASRDATNLHQKYAHYYIARCDDITVCMPVNIARVNVSVTFEDADARQATRDAPRTYADWEKPGAARAKKKDDRSITVAAGRC